MSGAKPAPKDLVPAAGIDPIPTQGRFPGGGEYEVSLGSNLNLRSDSACRKEAGTVASRSRTKKEVVAKAPKPKQGTAAAVPIGLLDPPATGSPKPGRRVRCSSPGTGQAL